MLSKFCATVDALLYIFMRQLTYIQLLRRYWNALRIHLPSFSQRPTVTILLATHVVDGFNSGVTS